MMQPSAYQANMPSGRNGAAILSLICAVVSPLSFLIPAVYNVVYNIVTGEPNRSGPTIPGGVSSLLGLVFALLPIIGVVAGSIGLYHAMKQPALKSTRWQALVGLLLSCQWVIAALVL